MSARDSYDKDLYAALGVSKDATSAEIKKAYRKLAQQFHPDRNPGDAKAEARFKEISEAYDVLSDTGTRQEYDEARAMFASGGFRAPGGGQGGGFNLNDLFNQGGGGGSFGDLFGNLFGQGAGRGPRRGADLEGSVTISFDEAWHGAEVGVRLPGAAACDTCRGSGAKPGTSPRTCSTCGGRGNVAVNQGGFAISEPCRDCRGRGQIIDTPCPTCGGTGRRERTQKIRVPAGIADGAKLRVRGRGSPGERSGPAGDLEVTVHVQPHKVFGRDGSSLTLTVPVTFAEAALGTEITVPTMDSPVRLRIPAGTSSGKRLRVKGRGVPKAKGHPGDLIVTIEVAVPAKLSDKARKALEAFAAESPDDPRAHLTEMVGTS